MYRCGLVLEGGGSRGIFTSGVLDALMENDMEFDYVIGASAGACNGASFIGHNIKRQHDITVDYVNDKRYMGISNMIKHGEFLNADWIFNELCYDISPIDQDRFENSGTTFCTVATNALTGKAEYFYPKNLRERGCVEIRSSCSLPGVTKGVKIGKDLYFDGGIADSIPLRRALEDGCQKTVVILTQHKGFVKKPVPEFTKAATKKYPLLTDAILNRHIMYNDELEFVEEESRIGNAFVIRPATALDCSALEKNVAKLESIYQLGYRQGIKSVDKIKEYLGK